MRERAQQPKQEWIFALGLPKKRSGKKIGRILCKISLNEIHQLGDTSTLADQSVVDSQVKGKL